MYMYVLKMKMNTNNIPIEKFNFDCHVKALKKILQKTGCRSKQNLKLLRALHFTLPNLSRLGSGGGYGFWTSAKKGRLNILKTPTANPKRKQKYETDTDYVPPKRIRGSTWVPLYRRSSLRNFGDSAAMEADTKIRKAQEKDEADRRDEEFQSGDDEFDTSSEESDEEAPPPPPQPTQEGIF